MVFRTGNPLQLTGRRREIDDLRSAVDAVADGRGRAIMIEGEAGIGKSALMALTLTAAQAAGCQIFHAAADELSRRLPLQVLAEAIDVRSPPWPRVASPAADSRARLPRWTADDPGMAVAEQILTGIDLLCSAAPTVLAIDDLQWADAASVVLLSRLVAATGQLPLLVLIAARTGQPNVELTRLRRRITQDRGLLLTVGPLSEAEAAEITGRLVSAAVGPGLCARVAAAGGNPLYVRETVDALVRDGTITIADGSADVGPSAVAPTGSLTSAIADRLDSLSAPTREVLRLASLLGHQVVVADLSALTGRTAVELMPLLEEALQACVLAEAGDRMIFRHGLIRDALYESMPLALRRAVHRQAAQALATTGAAPERVAPHLMAAPATGDAFTVDWLVEHSDALTNQAPAVAQELLARVLDRPLPDESAREYLQVALVAAAFRHHAHEVVETTAARLLTSAIKPEHAASVAWMLGYTWAHTGRSADGLAMVDAVTAEAPRSWQARLESLSAMLLFQLGRRGEARDRAEAVLRADADHTDAVAAGYARHVLSLLATRERRTVRAIALVDAALAALGDDPQNVDLRMLLLVNRTYWAQQATEGEASVRAARALSERHGGCRASQLAMAAAIHFFQVGRWDDALSELDERNVFGFEPAYRRILRLGLTALINARRGRLDAAWSCLADVPDSTADPSSRRSFFYAQSARGAIAEQLGDLAQAVALAAPLVSPDDQLMGISRHLWIARVTRVALRGGDPQLARRAAAAATADASAEPDSIRGMAARWCTALLDHDVAALDVCVDYYRDIGFVTLLGDVLGDAAEAAAAVGDPVGARSRMTQAARIYADLGAEFAVRRIEARLRTLGVRRGFPRRRTAPKTGWGALTASEVRVAELVAQGLSNPDIAAALFLSRGTVQNHVARILAKLEVRSRVEVARQVDLHHCTGEAATSEQTRPGRRAGGPAFTVR